MVMSSNFPRNRKIANFIALIYFISFAFIAFSVLRIAWHWSKLPEQFQTVIKRVPSAAWGLTALVAALNLTGAIQLSRMKRSAFNLFLAAFICVIAQYSDVFGLALPYSTPLRPEQWIALAGGAFVCLYTWRLRKIGQLE
jgi:hypothetical protein